MHFLENIWCNWVFWVVLTVYRRPQFSRQQLSQICKIAGIPARSEKCCKLKTSIKYGETMTLHIMHVNLAKGFRGGERQTNCSSALWPNKKCGKPLSAGLTRPCRTDYILHPWFAIYWCQPSIAGAPQSPQSRPYSCPWSQSSTLGLVASLPV